VTPSGVVTTLAGSGGAALVDGPGAAAAFNAPTGIALDPAGNVLVADKLNRRIRRVTAAGVVSTLNVGDAGASGKGAPVAVAVLPSGVVFAEAETHLIGTLSTAGSNSVLAGSVIGFADGPPASARFQEPSGLAVDPSGNLLVADTLNHGVRVIDATTLWTTTLAGTGLYGDADGTAVTASLAGPRGVAVGASGIVYVADAENARIRTILPPAPLPKGELEVTWTVAAGLDAIGSIAPITYTANANAPGHAAASCTMIRVYSAQGARIGCVIVGLASGVSYGVQVAALRGYTKGIPSPPLTGVPN
jgi:DNA-binding beta-propeller fold protein YncE